MTKLWYENRPIYAIIPSEYVSDDCVQIMFGYYDYMMLFGDSKLMYFNGKYKRPEYYENAYLRDGRRFEFPYSSIPEHIELQKLCKKHSVNQILDFGKPYIKVSDGLIIKYVAFEDGKNAILSIKLLNDYSKLKKAIINRQELEEYLKTGTLPALEDDYKIAYIFENGGIGNSEIPSEDYWLKCEKDILLSNVRDMMNRCYGSIDDKGIYHFTTGNNEEFIKVLDVQGFYEEYRRAIENLDDVLPFNLMNRTMIKFNEEGDIKIDKFQINYLQKDKYEVLVKTIKVINQKIKSWDLTSSAIFEMKARMSTLSDPKISRLLNPNISRKQLKEEKGRVLNLKK